MSAIIIFGLIALTLASVSVFRGYIFNQSLDLIHMVQPSINVLRQCPTVSLDFYNTMSTSTAAVAKPSQEVKQQFAFEKHPKSNVYRIVYSGLKNQKWYLSYSWSCDKKGADVFWSTNPKLTEFSYFEITPSKTKKAVYTLRAFAKDQTCNVRHLGISKLCSDTVVKLYPSSANVAFEFVIPDASIIRP